MQTRPIGRSGLQIAPFVLGGNVFGWTADTPTSFAILDAFVDAGFNAVDTANIYSCWAPGHVGGESEGVIGAWLAARGGRERIMLATKVGGHISDWSKGYLSSADILDGVDASLRRLRTDHIDLLQSHSDDPATPLEETLGAYQRLIAAGKVRAIGASHYSAARFRDALAVSERTGLPRYECLQPPYNLHERRPFEAELRELCKDAEIGVLGYSALAKGFLTGRFRAAIDLVGSQRTERMKPYFDGRGLRILAALDEVAAARGVLPAQVALAWATTQPGITAPIAAANNVEELQALIASASLALQPDELAALDAASALTEAPAAALVYAS